MRIPPTARHQPSLDDDVTFETPAGKLTGVVAGIDGDVYIVLVNDRPHVTSLKRIVSFEPFGRACT